MHSRSWSSVSAVAASLIVSGFIQSPALAQDARDVGKNGLGANEGAKASFDLPVQPLATTLHAIADKFDTNILFDPAQVRNIQPPAIKGAVTLQQVLETLLSGTKLSYRYMDERTISVIAKTSPTPIAEEIRLQ